MKEKKLIVIIEDDSDDIDAVINILDRKYEVIPEPKSQDFTELSTAFGTYNSLDYDLPLRRARIKIISDYLLKVQNKVSCFIVDYRLKENEGKSVGDKNGREFCENFEEEMGRVPILFLTSSDSAEERLDIIAYRDDCEVKGKLVRMMIKEGDEWQDDTKFKRKLNEHIDFLVNSYERLKPPA